MWLKLLSILLAVGLIQAYINSDNQYTDRSTHSKSSYLNYELNRFRHRVSTTTTTTEKAKYLPWNRSYQNQNYRNYNNNNRKVPETVNYDHKIRHTNNRFPKMDRLLNRMSSQNSKSADLTENPYRKYSATTEFNDLKSDNTKKPVQKWVTENPYKRLLNAASSSTTTTTEANEEHDAYFGEDETDDVKTKSSLDGAANHIETYSLQMFHSKFSITVCDLCTLDYTFLYQEDNDAANEDDDDLDDDEDDESENEDDTEEEEDDAEDESDDWQAEEPTEEPTERSFTEYKWKHYGTRARVEESRKNHGLMSTTMRRGVAEAVEHARRVNVLGACREPRPRLVRVHQLYPDAGKAYIPHCTLLHRCADDTGCCRSATLTCAPKHQATVHLHFYTGRPGAYTVEQLAFYNHTECHCVERTAEMMSRDAADDAASEDRYPLRPSGDHTAVQTAAAAPEPIRRCQCPELYTPQIVHGQCRCECTEGNRDCMRIKRGKEYFSLKDRLCIQKGECGYPSCEFGVYIRYSGRCPRKQEKLDAFARVQPQ